MIHRTLSEAQDERVFASWKQKVIIRVSLLCGKIFFRTYTFNQYEHKCKRCRKAKPQQQGRIASTGHVCETCGNPFAGFVREGRRKVGNKFTTLEHCWSSSGKLH